ncbi:hypothetical protein EYR36_000119 [Pleurotus pulmonarius]|nr:hypothetical protein EYR36_000119 [Pleurotus pulmonarius]KAF4604347.1 hypothetical protein EYR38_004769 [Pleurotus pulmonarius]
MLTGHVYTNVYSLPVSFLRRELSAYFLGLTISSPLCAIAISQGIFYYRTYGQDPRYLKFLVAILVSMDSIRFVFLAHTVYTSAMTLNDVLHHLDRTLMVVEVLGACLACLVQSAYVMRIWHTEIGGLIFEASGQGKGLCSFGGPFDTTEASNLLNQINIVSRYTQLGGNLMSDALITASMVYYFKVGLRGTNFFGTRNILNRLIDYVLTIGLITSILSIVSFAVFGASQDSQLYFPLIHFMICNVYVNSFLVSLNWRMGLRRAGLYGTGGMPLYPSQPLYTTFMPANISAPYGPGGAPLLPPPQQLTGALQPMPAQQYGAAAPPTSWALTKAEKKEYDRIFRSWDASGSGFISGQVALEIFGQSGLSKDDLARIWGLADVDDRGKLNLQEFYVAMGLIHRRLNGIPIPEQLPPELVPPSARDLEGSVSFLKDLLKDETRSRSPSSIDSPVSRLKDRSFNGSGSTLGTGRDATIYKYNDSEPAGGFYQPRSRHVNRSDVRTRDDQSPASNLSDLTRRLQNTAKLLDRSVEADATRTSEDDALDREMADLEYRAKRLQDDIEYVSHGPSSEAKNEERRRLERELVDLLHHRLPEVAKKIEAREERREKEKREWRHQRDRANERSGRFDYGDDRDRYSSRRVEEEREMNRSRGAYDYGRDRDRDDRGREYDRGSYRRDSPVDRYKDREPEVSRARTPPAQARSPPPPPPVTTSALSPPSTSSRSTPSPAPTKNMTPAERQEFARNEAKRRIQARMQALGISSPSTAASPTVDTSVEERLAEERREAEQKARIAEEKAAEREQSRRERLESEKALKEGKVTPSPAPTTPTPTSTAAAPTPTHKPAPPQPKPRAPAPPPPRKTAARPPPAPAAPPAPRPPAPPAVPTVDPEEEALRAREEALRKQREARAERIRQLEREEEEARLEEERFKARIAAAKATPVASPAVVSPPVAVAPPPPPAPPAPPSPAPPIPPSVTPRSTATSAVSTPSGASKTNPFRKEGGAPSPATLPPTNASSTNPFFRPQTAPPASVPTPPKTPTPVPVKAAYNTAPGDSDGEDWDAVREYDEDEDSSDDEITKSRDTRAKIAESLFGSGGGISRPSSTPATSAAVAAPRISSPAQVPSAPPPPPAPAPPIAPPAPTISPTAAPSGPGDVSALMKSIQGGAKLRSVQTIDKSKPQVLGRILGDDTPPVVNAAPRLPSPPSPALPETTSMIPASDGGSSKSANSNRQSVDWYAGLAADQGRGVDRLPSTTEEDEDEEVVPQQPASIPQIFVDLPVDSPRDPLADIDKTVEHRVRTLYPYTGDSGDDLTFGENLILIANPSKSGGDWWYGTIIKDGKSGLFPKTYVEAVATIKAKALYAYEASNSDELSFDAGDELVVIDTIEPEWWKVESRGQVFVVPASYLELLEGSSSRSLPDIALQVPMGSQEVSDIGSDPNDAADAPQDLESTSDEDSDASEDDQYYSASDGTGSDDEIESSHEREAREHERQLVLEAAGLVVKKDVEPPSPLLRRRSTRRRRPPPAAPRRTDSITSNKDLPAVPVLEHENDPSIRVADAFDRYEHFRQSHGSVNANRLSVASTSSMDTFGSPTSTTTISTRGRKTPIESERPVISAPILQLSPESPARSPSPAFGTSWASLIDKTALQGIPPNERKRQEAIFEFITTESAYVRDLQLIVEVFYSSMLPLLDTKAVTVVFANVEDILLTNTSFMSVLEERQKECRLYIDKIGDILQSHMPNMGVYMEYCVNQATAIQVLQSLRLANPELAAHLQHLRDDPVVRNLDLSSYLLAPMQRVTKYPLLIKQILHHTEPVEERASVQRALDIAESILNQINESIRYQEGRQTLKRISQNLWIGQGRLDLTAPTRYMGDRRLVKEGMLTKSKSRRKLQVFLCNDVLVLTDEGIKSLYRMPIPLAEVQVRHAKDDVAFQLALAYPRGGETIGLKASSLRDCLEVQAMSEDNRAPDPSIPTGSHPPDINAPVPTSGVSPPAIRRRKEAPPPLVLQGGLSFLTSDPRPRATKKVIRRRASIFGAMFGSWKPKGIKKPAIQPPIKCADPASNPSDRGGLRLLKRASLGNLFSAREPDENIEDSGYARLTGWSPAPHTTKFPASLSPDTQVGPGSANPFITPPRTPFSPVADNIQGPESPGSPDSYFDVPQVRRGMGSSFKTLKILGEEAKDAIAAKYTQEL